MSGKKGKRKEAEVGKEKDKAKAAEEKAAKDASVETKDAQKDAEEKKEASAEEETPAKDGPSREAELESRLLRLQADFENFRKRTLREREDTYRRANEDLMQELLPVLDHLELAFRAASKEEAEHPVVKGFRLVGEQLQQTLEKFGLQPIETEKVDFDPNVHEAILHLPSEEVPENGVIERTRAGYMLGNRLLRAAQVVVSSGPQQEATENE